VEHRNLTQLALIILFGILATTLPQPQGLGRLPLQFLLKTEVGVTREQMAAFFFWCGLAWYLKPLVGILTDAFPLFRTRRRHYLLISAGLASASWIGMTIVPHTYGALLWGAMTVNLFMVMASTVTGAFLVEAGQSMGATGRLTALREFVYNFCGLVQGPLGGLLATAGFVWATGANAAVALSITPIAYIFLRERPVARGLGSEAFHNAGRQLVTTPLFYKQTDELHFSGQAIGNLGVFSGFFGILAAAVYSQLIRRFHIRTMLFIGIVTAAAGTLLYLFYSTWTRAVFIESQNGFFFSLAELALMDLAARATPNGCEGLGYSLMLSIRNVALFGADIVGSHLADHKWPFASLVYLNAGTTAIVLVLLPFMPAALMHTKDQPANTTAPASIDHRTLETLLIRPGNSV
jgi:hypothetical protein